MCARKNIKAFIKVITFIKWIKLNTNSSNLNAALFREIKESFEFEWRRMEKLDEKAIHIATSTGTILTFFTALATFSLKEIDVGTEYFSYATILIIIILFLFITTIIISIFLIQTKSYITTDPELLIEEYADSTLEEFTRNFGGDMIDAINHNTALNNEKAANLDTSVKLLGMGVSSIFFYIMLIISYMVN